LFGFLASPHAVYSEGAGDVRLKEKKESKKGRLVFLLLIVGIATAGWFGFSRLEGTPPEVGLDLSFETLGSRARLTGTVTDETSGLREVWIALSRGGIDKVIYSKTWPSDGFPGKGSTMEDAVDVDADPGKLGLEDGKALLRIRVTDHSLRNWGKGNTTYIEKEITIDTKPPGVDILSRSHNVARGGAGVVVYRVSEEVASSGVRVGENFFPGYPGYFEGHDNVYVVFFALSHLQKKGTEIWVEAEDAAGNLAKSGFYHYIINKQFRQDRINISDGFLNAKIPAMSVDKFGEAPANNLEKWLVINSKMRADNNRTILGNGKKTEPVMHWKGTFRQLPGSATRALYADHRSYYYKGKRVDQKYHLGLDFASIRQAEIPAANAGRVVFAEEVGIYGKTVVIDHGFGLLSSYSHMSSMRVKEGDMLRKGDVIGRTGVTGLVGGDHLHFGMIVGDIFVNPIEWFDANWIKNNVTSKLEQVKRDLSRK
jgi:murein DD-endopeptidase MepM/ murein hydrolase activator NlpD